MGHKSSSLKKLQGGNQQQLPAQAKRREATKLTSRKRDNNTVDFLWREVQKEDWNMPGDKDVMDVEKKINFIPRCCSRQKEKEEKRMQVVVHTPNRNTQTCHETDFM